MKFTVILEPIEIYDEEKYSKDDLLDDLHELMVDDFFYIEVSYD